MHFRRMFNDRKHHKRSKRGVNKVFHYFVVGKNFQIISFSSPFLLESGWR